jgi:hypothetical protein
MKRILTTLILILIIGTLLSSGASVQTELEISGIPVKVVAAIKASINIHFAEVESISTTHFVVVVIPTGKYSRENIETIWQQFKQRYSDKKETLDLKIYTTSTYDFNRQKFGDRAWVGTEEFIHQEPSPRKYEARFERLDVALTKGKVQELLYYIPDLTKPEERKVVVLAGKDPFQ